MIEYYVTNSSGMVIMSGSTNAALSDIPLEVGESAHKGSAAIGQLKKGKKLLNTPPSVLLDRIRVTRNMLLNNAGAQIAELSLQDSFPKITAAQKQAKIDALILYRQALRDITLQPDPANITWPEVPL